MKEGLLWYDNDPKRLLSVKVSAAVARYRERLGHNPTVCYLNEKDMNGGGEVSGVRLEVRQNVLKGHLLVGVE